MSIENASEGGRRRRGRA